MPPFRKGVMCVDEEVVLLEEQLTAAHADIERLQQRLGEAEERATARDTELTDLRRQLEAGRKALADSESVVTLQAEELEGLRGRVASIDERESMAAGRYRDLVLAHEPALPAELVG